MTDNVIPEAEELKCPHCGNDNKSMLELIHVGRLTDRFYCEQCSKEFIINNRSMTIGNLWMITFHNK